MITTANNLTPLKNIFINSEIFSLKTYLLSAIAVCLLFAVAHIFGVALYALLAIVGFFCVWLMLHYPRIWIYCVVLGCSLFFAQTEDDIDAVDILATVLFNLFLILWFVCKLLVKSEKQIHIFRTSNSNSLKNSTLHINNLTEKLFLLFYVFLIANFAIAFFNGVPITDWIREFAYYTLMLYFFPIAEYIKAPRHIITFLLLLGFVVLFLDLKQFYNCYLVFSNIRYAFQVGGTIRVNQAIYSAAALSGIVFYFFSKNKTSKIFIFVLVALSAGAIITTFSRVYWGAILVCVLFICVFLTYKQLLHLFMIVLLSMGLMFVTLDTFLPKQSSFVKTYVAKRFTSSTKGKKDISVRARINEMKAVTAKIKESPLVGYGLRSTFTHYFSITQTTVSNHFVHNGYVNLAHKTGIPVAVLFYLTLILFTLRGGIVAWKLRKYCHRIDKKVDEHSIHLYSAIAISAVATLLMIFITNFATSSFIFRDGLMSIAISIAFINIATNKLNEIQNTGLILS